MPVMAVMRIAVDASNGRIEKFIMDQLQRVGIALRDVLTVSSSDAVSYRNRRAFRNVECYVPRRGTKGERDAWGHSHKEPGTRLTRASGAADAARLVAARIVH